MTDERPLAFDAYEALADGYAERAPTKPFNADLERPATLGLLPEIDGEDVLDAGCGPGITTEELLDRGARVVGVDASPAMLRNARKRVGNRANLLQANLADPLPFADERLDLVYSSLVFDYVRDWESLFAKIARVLRDNGTLVFSAGHPMADVRHFDPDDYFETERVSETWTSFGDPVDVPTYRRPLEAVLNPLVDAGFRLKRFVDAKPTERFREKDPETYERVSRRPTFLCLRARLA